MANADRPRGLWPIRMMNGSSNIPVNRYPVATGNSTAIFIGDIVTKGTTTNNVTPIGATHTFTSLGVVVGIDGDFGDLSRRYLPASTAGNVFVADAPETIFGIQDSATAGVAAMGANAAVLQTAGHTTSGQSRYELNSATPGTTSTWGIRLIRPIPREDNDATTVNADWEVMLNRHEYAMSKLGELGV